MTGAKGNIEYLLKAVRQEDILSDGEDLLQTFDGKIDEVIAQAHSELMK